MIFGGRPQVPAAAPTPPAAPSPVATMASRVGNTGSGMGTAMRTYNMGQAQAGATSNPFLNYVRANRAPQAGAGMMNSAPGSAYTLGNTATPLGGGMATGGIDPNRNYTPETIPGAAPLGPPAKGGMGGGGGIDPNRPYTPETIPGAALLGPPLSQSPPPVATGSSPDHTYLQASPADQQQQPALAPPPPPTWHPQNLTGLNRMQSQRSRQDMGGLNRLYY